MKLFRDDTTGMMFISIADKKENLLHFDGSPYIGNLDNVSEVDTDGLVPKFHRQHVVEEDLDINDDAEWHLKDVLYVPIGGETVEFRVEHISDDKVYFVAIDAITSSAMTDTNQLLNKYLSNMPKSLVNRMADIEHKVDGEVICKGKLALLSLANVVKDVQNYKLDGTDDIPFGGLLTEAERCKNLDKETNQYWLDTPDSEHAKLFLCVSYDGMLNTCGRETNIYAVVPCFALKRKE